MRRICIAILLLLLASCRDEVPKNRQLLPQKRPIINFTPEITMTKTVGETMIERGNMEVYPGFKLTEDLPPVYRGEIWGCHRSILIDNVWCYMCLTTGAGIPTLPGYPASYYDLAINNSGGIIGIVEKRNGSLNRFDNVIAGKLLPIDLPTKGSYKQELIYNGKTKDTIRLSYREYVDDMARPAFYQDLTYDLAESREIAFRDIRIEVLEATNSGIKFFVKK
jgi:hypothetical protein